MDGIVMRKLADALNDVGYVIKKIEEETYGQFDRPSPSEKYTGEIIIKIRPAKDEEADLEKERTRKKREEAKLGLSAPTVPASASSLEEPF